VRFNPADGAFSLGELYLLRGKTDEVVGEFKKELQIEPMMGLAYWRMRNQPSNQRMIRPSTAKL